ncbi:MAG TPA: ABC transporter permease [Terriglobales bacterium]|nr:ABC transporter permease [Terriglobales bacterium]
MIQITSALRTLARQRRRSLAMSAGLVAGLALGMTLSSVSAASRRATLASVKNMLGTFDTILVRPGGGKTRGMVSLTNVPPTLTFDDADAIAALPAIRQAAELQNAFDIDVEAGGRTHAPAVFGVSGNWLDLRGDAMLEGSFFSPEQMRSEARVAILGADVAAALFPDGGPHASLGQSIRLGTVPFQVQGRLAPRGAGPGGFSLDDLILIPVTTASHRLFNRNFLTMVVAQLRTPGDTAAAMAQVRTLLRQRHHASTAALDDFTLTDPSAVAAQVTAVSSRLAVIGRGAALGAIVLAAIAIVALMWLGVSERRTEIGLRRAVGATRASILGQFLLEIALLSSLAAGAGLALGGLGIFIASRWQHLPPEWAWPQAFAAAFAAILLGIACGLTPAWHAARTDPVAALRR